MCWAHLKRNWEKQAERGGVAGRICGRCLDVQRRVFELWHRIRGGGCPRGRMDERTVPLAFELLAVLQGGGRTRDRKRARFGRRILRVYPGLWTFVAADGVEPTNNHERVLRRAVLWRRRSFGCHSAAGCRFVERILTAVQTVRLQQRSVLEFLYETMRAHREGLKAPRLIVTG